MTQPQKLQCHSCYSLLVEAITSFVQVQGEGVSYLPLGEENREWQDHNLKRAEDTVIAVFER